MSVIDNSWSNQNRKTNNEPDSPTTFHPLKSVKALCTQGDTWRANLAQYLHSTFNWKILKCWTNIHFYRPSREITHRLYIWLNWVLKVWAKECMLPKIVVFKKCVSFFPYMHVSEFTRWELSLSKHQGFSPLSLSNGIFSPATHLTSDEEINHSYILTQIKQLHSHRAAIFNQCDARNF